MFTINLKEKLLSEKEKQLQLDSLSLGDDAVTQANRLLEDSANSDLKILAAAGFKRAIDSSKQTIEENERQNKLSKDKNLFSIEEIRKICIKYRLRFLPVEDYEGTMDSELPKILREYGKTKNNFYICAPVSSFAKVVPKDPLLFVEEGDSYRLLHKWGNDPSVLRRVLGFFTSSMLKVFSILFIMLTLGIFYFVPVEVERSSSFYSVSIVVSAFVCFIVCAIFEEKYKPSRDCWNEHRKV